ncbi:MAG: amidohydrolase [Deltaproteobacteria bacterium]|nr:amidohydrolase [Deltaproteobacteria bacterium]
MIDLHTHLLPPEIPRWAQKFGSGGFVQLEMIRESAGADGLPCRARMMKDDGTFFRDVERNLWDARTRLQECDAAGVGVQVLSTVPVMFSYWARPEHGAEVARFLNDHLAGVCAEHPRRLVGLGTLPMQAPDLALRELERCKELKLRGVQIGSHVNDWNLDAPALFPIFARAAELGLCVFVHPWDMMAQAKMQKYWLPWLVGMPAEVSLAICSLIFGGVLERLPSLRIAFAHGGGAFPGTLGRIQHGFEARPDLCAIDNPHPPVKYVSRIVVDALVHEPRALKLVLETFGVDNVALGTDYPFPLGEGVPGQLIRSLNLPRAAEERLLWGTALQLLGMSASELDLAPAQNGGQA